MAYAQALVTAYHAVLDQGWGGGEGAQKYGFTKPLESSTRVLYPQRTGLGPSQREQQFTKPKETRRQNTHQVNIV